MSLFTFLLFLGAAGLLTMALQGIGGGHGDGHGHSGGHGHGHGHGHSSDGHSGGGHGKDSHGPSLWSLMSPRVLFSVVMGIGATGTLLQPVFGTGVLAFIPAIAGGLLFERFFVSPLWNFMFRFASKPALMLESVIETEGTAVTAFDRNGQGIIVVDLDGQVVQLLATLQPDDITLGAAVRAGDRVRIADVDSARNRCTVAVL